MPSTSARSRRFHVLVTNRVHQSLALCRELAGCVTPLRQRALGDLARHAYLQASEEAAKHLQKGVDQKAKVKNTLDQLAAEARP